MKPEEAEAWRAYRAEFDRVWQYLKPSLAHVPDMMRKPHFWEEIEAGRMELWPLPRSAAITQVKSYPTGLKIFCVILAGGDKDEILGLLPTWRERAREIGCKHLTAEGRDGWVKTLNKGRRLGSLSIEDL